MSELFPYEYVGAGFFVRKRPAPGEPASLHGEDVVKYIEERYDLKSTPPATIRSDYRLKSRR